MCGLLMGTIVLLPTCTRCKLQVRESTQHSAQLARSLFPFDIKGNNFTFHIIFLRICRIRRCFFLLDTTLFSLPDTMLYFLPDTTLFFLPDTTLFFCRIRRCFFCRIRRCFFAGCDVVFFLRDTTLFFFAGYDVVFFRLRNKLFILSNIIRERCTLLPCLPCFSNQRQV